MGLTPEELQEEARFRLKVYPRLLKALRQLAMNPTVEGSYVEAYEVLALADMLLCPVCKVERVARQTALMGLSCQKCMDEEMELRAKGKA